VAAGAPLERLERTFRLDDSDAPRQARAAVADFGDIADDTRDDLQIIVSELVANAVRHAPRVPAGDISVSIARDDDGFYIQVRDPGAGFDPRPDPTRLGGLGLLIVDRIADAWGIDTDGQTTVWCRLRN